MKNLLRSTIVLLCAGIISCSPGKFAGGIEGVIVDSKSSSPVPGATIRSRIPHKGETKGSASSVTSTNQFGKFSFRPVYGIYQLLEMPIDWRELTIKKDGYEELRVSVFQRGSVRITETGERAKRIETPRSEELRISINKK
jgi:hypothetical protein